jgi:maltodextrin utilization protein YvdJ
MSKDKMVFMLIAALVLVVLANSFVLAQVYQNQQIHNDLNRHLADQMIESEVNQNATVETLTTQLLILENRLIQQSETIEAAKQQIEWLGDENELLKKKLQ